MELQLAAFSTTNQAYLHLKTRHRFKIYLSRFCWLSFSFHATKNISLQPLFTLRVIKQNTSNDREAIFLMFHLFAKAISLYVL